MTGPTILAFDTSAPACAAALLHNGMVTTRVDEMAKGQAEHLIPMLEEMLSTAGLLWADLDGIGVALDQETSQAFASRCLPRVD